MCLLLTVPTAHVPSPHAILDSDIPEPTFPILYPIFDFSTPTERPPNGFTLSEFDYDQDDESDGFDTFAEDASHSGSIQDSLRLQNMLRAVEQRHRETLRNQVVLQAAQREEVNGDVRGAGEVVNEQGRQDGEGGSLLVMVEVFGDRELARGANFFFEEVVRNRPVG